MKSLVLLCVITILSLWLYSPASTGADRHVCDKDCSAQMYHLNYGDTITVFMKDGRPFVKIDAPNFPDLPQCKGLQIYKADKTFSINMGDKTAVGSVLKLGTDLIAKASTGFALWKSEACTAALEEIKKRDVKPVPTRHLVQEIDVYNDFLGRFENKNEVISGFVKGEIRFAVMFQDGYRERGVKYTYQDVQKGRVLKKKDPAT